MKGIIRTTENLGHTQIRMTISSIGLIRLAIRIRSPQSIIQEKFLNSRCIAH